VRTKPFNNQEQERQMHLLLLLLLLLLSIARKTQWRKAFWKMRCSQTMTDVRIVVAVLAMVLCQAWVESASFHCDQGRPLHLQGL